MYLEATLIPTETNFVVKGYGKLKESLLPGEYTVTFGSLYNKRIPFELDKDGMTLHE